MYILVKIFEKEDYAEQFLQGTVYANHICHFRNLEDDQARSDQHEGVTQSWGSLTLETKNESIHIPKDDLAGPVEFKMEWTNRFNFFCMSQVGFVQKGDSAHLDFPEGCSGFGEHAVIILNRKQFISRIKEGIKETRYELFGHGAVIYDDNPPLDLCDPKIVFRKGERYKKQREYRFAFHNEWNWGPIVIDIGDISDIAVYRHQSHR